MRKLLAILSLLCFALGSQAADIITATITVTNTAGTTNGQTILVNGNTRIWTNSAVVPAAQILTNSTIGGAATNLFNQVSANPYTGPNLALTRYGTNGILLQAPPGGALAVTLSAGWGDVVLSTNVTTSATVVRVPHTAEAAAQQTNVTSGVVAMLNAAPNTNIIFEGSASVNTTLLGITNNQTVAGIKLFTNVAGQWKGIVSNGVAISGTVYGLTNGVFWTNTFSAPMTTNLTNYGSAISSAGSGTGSEQFGTGARATGTASTAIGQGALASGGLSDALGFGAISDGTSSTAIGAGSMASNNNATAIGEGAIATNANATAIGQSSRTTANSQLMFGSSTEYAHFPGNVRIDGNTELRWARFPITTLATGNNAAVAVGTNTFCEVSGPGAAFTINGIANGSDGKFLIILNQTGFNMTIAHESGTDPVAANRIVTMTGADQATTSNGAAMLIYSGAASRWILLSLAL